MATKDKPIANLEILDAITKVASNVGRIESEMNAQHQEKMDELVEIKKQVKYTNGRVSRMERKWSDQEAVDKYKLMNPPTSSTVKVETSTTWDWKTVLAILLTLATAVVAIAGVTK